MRAEEDGGLGDLHVDGRGARGVGGKDACFALVVDELHLARPGGEQGLVQAEGGAEGRGGAGAQALAGARPEGEEVVAVDVVEAVGLDVREIGEGRADVALPRERCEGRLQAPQRGARDSPECRHDKSYQY